MGSNSISKSYMYNLAFQVLSVFLPFITTPYLSRVLGAGNLGIYSYTTSLTGFFLLFASLGVLSYGSREIARVRENKSDRSRIFWELVLFKLVVVPLSFCAFFAFYISYEKVYLKFYLLLSFEFLASLLDLSWYYRGMEMFKGLSIRNSLVKIAGTLCIFIFVKDDQAMVAYILCVVLPNLIGNVLLWKKALSQVEFISLGKLNIQRHVKGIMVFFIPAISVQIYHTVDKLMLQWVLHDNYQNGYYDQAYKIVTILLTILTAYNSVMYSRMSNLYKHGDYDVIHSYLDRSIPFIELLGFPMAVGLWAIAPRFVPIFFGEGYSEVVTLLRIFSPMILITGLSNMVANQCLVPAGKQGKSNIAVVTGAVVNIIFNCILIPEYGAVGACMATILSEMVILVIMCYYQKGMMRKIIKQSSNYLLASAVMLSAIEILHWIIPDYSSFLSDFIAMALLILTGMLVYFGILLFRKDSALLNFTQSIRKQGLG